MDIPGFLQIDDPAHGCVVLVDNHMTRQLVAADEAMAFEVDTDCPDCGCQTLWCGVDQIEDTPWYDPNRPGSTEFFGLHGQLRIVHPPSTNTFTTTGVTTAAALKQLTFVGWLAASTARGAAFGREWVQKQLEPLCVSCSSRSATIGMWCPDDLCDPTTPSEPATPEIVDWSTIVGLDGCTDPDLLGPAGPTVSPADSGLRQLMKIDYVPGSFTPIEDPVSPMPVCYGLRVTFSFNISSEKFLPIEQRCIMRAPTEGEPEPCCVPLEWDLEEPIPDCGCARPCSCYTPAPGSSVDSGAFAVLPDGAAECRFSTPLCSQTFACLTEPFSAALAAPTIRITAGDSPLRNVTVRVWEAVQGLPNPMTPLGHQAYSGRAPLAEPALIDWIAAGTTRVIDGRTESEWVECPGEPGPLAAPVVTCGNRKYRHPPLCCGKRYWITVDTDCYNTSRDWEVEVFLSGRERV